VGFRELTDAQLEHYLEVEQPYNCAGSFKSEGYGITLFSHLHGDDPTALVGLPLIRLTEMLEQAGMQVV
jgi:septum formation protein